MKPGKVNCRCRLITNQQAKINKLEARGWRIYVHDGSRVVMIKTVEIYVNGRFYNKRFFMVINKSGLVTYSSI